MNDGLVLLVLTQARRTLERDGAWCQDASARDRFGASVDPDSPHACRWCGTGAIWAEARRIQRAREGTDKPVNAHVLALEAQRRVEDNLPIKQPLEVFNDTAGVTERDVVRAFARAIETLSLELADRVACDQVADDIVNKLQGDLR